MTKTKEVKKMAEKKLTKPTQKKDSPRSDKEVKDELLAATTSYRRLIEEAQNLINPSLGAINPEFEKGMAEVIARAFSAWPHNYLGYTVNRLTVMRDIRPGLSDEGIMKFVFGHETEFMRRKHQC